MKVLIYKRTHKGDSDKSGVFGIQDCMGQIRDWDYDAVIGIGGKVPWKKYSDIKYKINWIGINPRRIESNSKRGSYVVFEHYDLQEGKGRNIKTEFPNLFDYMFSSRNRFKMPAELPPHVFEEVNELLNSAKKFPPSEKFYLDDSEFKKLDEETRMLKSTCKNADIECEFILEDSTC